MLMLKEGLLSLGFSLGVSGTMEDKVPDTLLHTQCKS